MLTQNRTIQAETAFILYLYISRQKILPLHKTCFQETCIDHRHSNKENVSNRSQVNQAVPNTPLMLGKTLTMNPGNFHKRKLSSISNPPLDLKAKSQSTVDGAGLMSSQSHFITSGDDVVMTT